MVEEFEMPRALPEALIEGLVWDAMGKNMKHLTIWLHILRVLRQLWE